MTPAKPIYSAKGHCALFQAIEEATCRTSIGPQWKINPDVLLARAAELTQDARDAARYRWLRNNAVHAYGEELDFELRYRFGHLFHETLDQAIDQELATAPQPPTQVAAKELICARCGADRLKEECRIADYQCPMIGTPT